MESPRLHYRERPSARPGPAALLLHGNFASSAWWAPRRAQVLDLVLFGPAPLDGLRGMRSGDGAMARLIRSFDPARPGRMPALRMALDLSRRLGTHPRQMEEAIRGQLAPGARGSVAVRALARDAARQSTRVVVGYLEAMAELDHTARARSLLLPAEVVWGEEDEIVPQAAAEAVAAALPLAVLSTWPAVGHAPMLEAPERTARHLAERWGTTRAPSSFFDDEQLSARLGW